MKNDLIDRYIYAATKRMNPKIREDVQKELYGLVDDMLTERCGNVTPTEKDIRVVLTELGTPQEVFAKYDEDSHKSLIGSPYYGTYIFVLKIVLAAMAIGMTVVTIMTAFSEMQQWLEIVVSWVSLMWSGMLQAFGIVTIIFAVLSHHSVQLGEPYNLDDLPAVPKKRQEISRGKCIFAITFCVVLLILLLAAPQYLIGYWGQDGVIPLFDTNVLANCWYLILLFGLADIVRSVIRLIEGQYNRKVLITTVVSNAVAAVAVSIWLTRPALINPEFATHVGRVFAAEDSFMRNIFVNFPQFLLAVILFALIVDLVEAAVRTFKK